MDFFLHCNVQWTLQYNVKMENVTMLQCNVMQCTMYNAHCILLAENMGGLWAGSEVRSQYFDYPGQCSVHGTVQCSAVQCSAVQCSAVQYPEYPGHFKLQMMGKLSNFHPCGAMAGKEYALHCTALHCTEK
jgi:hypothetical protein